MNRMTGIRLHNLEIYNWGTFDKKVWKFNPDGHTSLLTGDSGSGKSTIVDALSTLLVPPRKLAYNKAADASAKERTVKSYVLGYYGRKYSHDGKGKPEKLRDEKNYSVILATWKEDTQNKTLSLAIFFWFKDNESDPSKLYVVSEQELFISKDFSNFESDIKFLRNRLKREGAKLFDNFSNYSESYRKHLGGLSEQAIELFQQTVSMKKVEALNEFVRESMLEKEDIRNEIEELLRHYGNLNSAYEAVVRAKMQINQLTPVDEKGKSYVEKVNEREILKRAADSSEIWFATKYKDILSQIIARYKEEIAKTEYIIQIETNKQTDTANEIKRIEFEINQNGGNELTILENELQSKKKELEHRRILLRTYDECAQHLNLRSGKVFEDYEWNKRQLPALHEELKQKSDMLQEELEALGIRAKEYETQAANLEKEIASLRSRTSNIPARLVELRERLCGEMNIDTSEISFVGELLEVKKSEIRWEGAIERLAHSFAISLLVPKEYYTHVSDWVNQNHLKTKLVYFKVDPHIREEYASYHRDSVSNKLEIKQDNKFAKWLKNELNRRFPHISCENMEDFRRETKAITIRGQIRSGQKHEKDDRQNIQDKTKYVLGFSNKEKIEAIGEELAQITEELRLLHQQRSEIRAKQTDTEQPIFALRTLMAHESHEMIDVTATESVIEEKERRIREINQSNSILPTLEKQKREKEIELQKLSKKISEASNRCAVLNSDLKKEKKNQEENEEILKQETERDRESYAFLEIDYANYTEKLGTPVVYSEKNKNTYRNDLHKRSSNLSNSIEKLRVDTEKLMSSFKREYPVETSEMTDGIESLAEYSEMLKKLLYDNLPKYQAHFKEELRGKITKHISLFHVRLLDNSKNIEKRIDEINESLRSIPYNIGRYITLNCEDTVEQDIRGFKSKLKLCTEGMTTMADDLAEQKFLQIKEIIERFKGRAEFLEVDKRWTAKVTDVRNWFVFSATERYIENDEEYEHYSDSDGKSGGQKEKLAYTILAASLAYNYRLNKKMHSDSSFRLVVIDEAFLKSSDESAKFGLSLFQKMRFQLLVVTPLLKISTIEPFISHIGYVTHNDITHISEIENLSIETYRERRKTKVEQEKAAKQREAAKQHEAAEQHEAAKQHEAVKRNVQQLFEQWNFE